MGSLRDNHTHARTAAPQLLDHPEHGAGELPRDAESRGRSEFLLCKGIENILGG